MKNKSNFTSKELILVLAMLGTNGKKVSVAKMKQLERKARKNKNDQLSYFVLLAVRTSKVKGKLVIPDRIGDFIITAQGVEDAITNDVGGFYNPAPAFLNTLHARNLALQAAEADVVLKVADAIGDRNTKRNEVELSLEDAVDYINGLVRNNQANAVSIITGANMVVIDMGVRVKEAFGAKRGTLSGTATLSAKKVARASSYLWQWSVDDQATWTEPNGTSGGKYTASRLRPLSKVWFRFKAILTKGDTTDWCQPIYVIIL